MGAGANQQPWQSRIVGYRDVPPDDLVANPRNWRGHPPHQSQALGDVLSEVGWVQSVIHNVRTGRLIDGHLRVDMAKARGEATVPVVDVDLSEDEEALILATIDPIGALAEANAASLAELVKGIEIESEAVRAMLKSVMDEASPIIAQGRTDPDAVPEPPAEPITKRGDLWLLGEHRLICGDATDGNDVARALPEHDKPPMLMVTDPPYGVEYDPAWRSEAAAKGHLAYAARRVGEVSNDDKVDWAVAWAFFPGDVVYCWHAGRHASKVQDSIEQNGFEVRNQIIWSKPHFPISRGHYHWRHEPCWYAVRRGAQAHWVGDHAQTTIWNVALDANVGGGHSTQKPVECMQRPLRNHEGDVYDPFLGSGTTLIAAEQLGRRCYGLEIEPRYCDVIVRRWEEFTGKKAERRTKGVDTPTPTGVGVPR